MFAASKTAAITTAANWIEECFSVYLYTGTGSSQTITNNIDTSTKGGLVWIKGRSGATGHRFTDTVRGATKSLESNSTAAQATESTGLTAFGTTGFTIGADADYNTNTATYVSWTFREQAKFFDVVTWTGNGVNGRAISHSLGSTPGAILVKCTSDAETWFVWHRSRNTEIGVLNATDAFGTYVAGYQAKEVFGDGSSVVQPTSTNFTVAQYGATNQSGRTYVAYLFAHDAGGFGATGTDNVISCGSVTNTTTVNLGYEPQWIMVKRTDSTSPWYIVDNMRGMNASYGDYSLSANSAGAETLAGLVAINATGMTLAVVGTYIYIAIRRGPMKTPTSGTSVFNLRAGADGTGTGNVADTTEESKIMKVDLAVFARRGGSVNNFQFADKLRGFQNADNPPVDSLTTPTLKTSNADSEATSGNALYVSSENNSTVRWRSDATGGAKIAYAFRRAPGFFDVVCYTGTTADNTQTHNLSAVPELIIIKRRDAAQSWAVFNSFTSTQLTRSFLNLDGAATTYLYTDNVGVKQQPTSTQFVLNGANTFVNVNAGTYVAYLFATVAGVSKVGSYTGNGSSQTINCGFAAGARFILIKRTDSTGDWYVWDTARGIVAGNDPRLSLNSTAAEVTTDDSIDPDNSGFIVNQLAATNINVSSATYIYLAIA